MSDDDELKITEAGMAQFPMIRHAVGIGWKAVSPGTARLKRGGDEGILFRGELTAKLREFNPWLTEDDVRRIIDAIEALHPTIDGNREALAWLRGERTWYDQNEERRRAVKVVDFQNPNKNTLQVTWEWKLKPPARTKETRADVMFIVNGIPVCIVEHKNPKKPDAVKRGLVQLTRYEAQTPELLGLPQLFNVSQMLDYWYGVTWNYERRGIKRWKQQPEETYRFAVEAFFEPTDFLRTLEQWILFYVKDGETKKTVLREHQRGAIDRILARCADPDRHRGLIWHSTGSGKTFTLLSAARLLLTDAGFGKATVVVVVDRIDLEGQISGWIERLLGEMQALDIATAKAGSGEHLQELLDSDFRGLILTTIYKFDEMRKHSNTRENVYVFIDEAHRSVAKDLGSYLMAALPNATIIGFTGTPVATSVHGKSTFAIFGLDDHNGYLHKYSTRESIDDETTVPIRHTLAPSELVLPSERLDKEFFALAGEQEITDIGELDKVLREAVNLRTFLGSNDRVRSIAAFVTEHFLANVKPEGYKALLVAVDRETCAKYQEELNKLLGPGVAVAVYSPHPDDIVERPLVYRHQISKEQEEKVREEFRKPNEGPQILIVTDKLLTGYDAEVLYCMYLDKPMRDHVLLQAISRVNRPYEDKEGRQKPLGLIIDFVGVLSDLKKALQFDSADLSGVVASLDELMKEFLVKIEEARAEYLLAGEGSGDERLEQIVFGRFGDPDERRQFADRYKHLENLYEILSPDEQLRDHLKTFERLADLYRTVRNAYADKIDPTGDLARKTRQLIQESASHHSLDTVTKSVTFDAKSLEALRDEGGPDEGKVFNLVRGLQRETDESPEAAAILVPLWERAERVRQNLADRKIDTERAMALIEGLIRERVEAENIAKDNGLGGQAIGLYIALREDADLIDANIDPVAFAREVQYLLERYPNADVDADERRLFRRDLYKPLGAVPALKRAGVVERSIFALFRD